MKLDFEIQADPRSRWKIDPIADGIRLHIPPRKRWASIVFCLFWLVLWGMAECRAIGALLRHDTSDPQFDAVWLIAWTMGGAFVLGFVLWQLTGEVVLEVSQGKFKHRLALGPLSVGRAFDIQQIRNLRASRVSESAFTWSRFSGKDNYLGRGLILFDYGERSIVIRPDLEPNEANNVANLLGRHIPSVSV